MGDFSTELRPVARQELTTVLSTEQRHSLELLQYSSLELEQYLTVAVASNPLLDEETPIVDTSQIALSNSNNIISDKEDETQIEAQTVEGADSWSDELPLPNPTDSNSREDADPFSHSVAPPPPRLSN